MHFSTPQKYLKIALQFISRSGIYVRNVTQDHPAVEKTRPSHRFAAGPSL